MLGYVERAPYKFLGMSRYYSNDNVLQRARSA